MKSGPRTRPWSPMLPRYSPAIAWREALGRAEEDAPGGAIEALASALLPGIGQRRLLPVAQARQALLAHYLELKGRVGPGTIVLPAQICPVVPAVIRAAGLRPLALDGDGVLPTPGPEQYSKALTQSSVVGAMVAPMSGYVQSGWSAMLATMPSEVDLMIDLAQSPLSASAFEPEFLKRADAVVFSFGVGKGFDTGGGLLASRREGSLRGTPSRSRLLVLTAVSRSAAIRAIMGLGAYRILLPLVDRMATNDVQVTSIQPVEADMARCWLTRYRVVAPEFALASARSAALSAIPAVRRSCQAVDSPGAPMTRPLRQLLRLRPGIDRATVLFRLRAAGLDCAPAGEPFEAGEDPRQWPAAEAFTRDAIRLPFLGRFSRREFDRVAAITEEVLTVHGL